MSVMRDIRLDDPIALFDSGVGGLSVLRHVQAQLPNERLIYLADQAHVPYGPRTASEVRRFSVAAIRFFLSRRAKLVIIACNTATAAALAHLRDSFGEIPFVGMEPAVKPGANATRTGKVGVLATVGTFESQRYTSLMARFAQNITLYENPCLGLVEQIEGGRLDTPETEALLQTCLQPMVAAGVDTLVLGCTHYPFVSSLIERIVGPEIIVIDPAPAVVRQAARRLGQLQLLLPESASAGIEAFTTGSPDLFARQAQQLLGVSLPVTPLTWKESALQMIS